MGDKTKTRAKKSILMCALLLCFPNLVPTIIITYKQMDPSYQYRTDFAIASNRIDPILDIGDDDFSRQGPFGTNIGQPNASFVSSDNMISSSVATPSLKVADNLTLGSVDEYYYNNYSFLPTYDQSYLDYYNQTVFQVTNPLDSRRDNFNLGSGGSFQLSDFPSDFNITTDLYKPDPQLMTLKVYFINNVAITPGQRIVLSDNIFDIIAITKTDLNFSGQITAGTTMEYIVKCPDGARIEFDVTDLSSVMNATTISTQSKGCVLLNQKPVVTE